MYNNNKQRPIEIMNAVITTGEYRTKQGELKKSYLTIGKLFIYHGGGMALKLDAFPTGNQVINFYPMKSKPKQQQQQYNQPQPNQYNQNQYNQPQPNQYYN